MTPEVFVKTADDSANRQRSAAAHSVIECLRDQFPNRRLLCFLDDRDWQALKEEFGAENRGLYIPASCLPLDLPLDIEKRLMVDHRCVFDDFIYLHGGTCSSVVSLTMTLAHELQHFIQHGGQKHLWAANSLIPGLNKTTLQQLRLRPCDVPIEREARIVSKRICEKLFGAESVRRHIDEKIASPPTAADASDWECIQGIVTATPYDLAHETKLFFQTLKGRRAELEMVLGDLRSRCKDFESVDLDGLVGGEDGIASGRENARS